MIQALVGGLTSGATYALLGLGIVLVYSVARQVNMVQGEFYVLGALTATSLVAVGMPVWLAAILACVLSIAIAALLDRLVFSRLTMAPHAAQLLGGIGVAFVLGGVARLIWGPDPRTLPPFVDVPSLDVFGVQIGVQVLIILATLVLCCVGLWLLLHRTMVGLTMRTVAALGSRAGLLGISVRNVGTLAFALAGMVGAMVGIVVTPLGQVSFQSGLQLTLLGFIAAAFGGLRSISGTVAGGLALGVLEAVTAHLGGAVLRTPIALGIFVLILVYRGGREGGVGTVTNNWRTSRRIRSAQLPLPVRRLSLSAHVRGARATWTGIVLVLIFAAAGPLTIAPFWISVWSFIGVLVIVGVGLDLLLGYTGQLSLGQTAFMGVAAYITALSPNWWNTGAWGSAVIAVLGTTAIAVVLGVVVLRLTGYYFALATLAVGIAAEALVNGLPALGGPSGVAVPAQFSLAGLDLNTPEALFSLTWAVVAVCLLVASRLVRSRHGIGMRAVAHDEQFAAASAVSPFRVKLGIFVVSSAMAGLGGVLYAHLLLFVSPSALGLSGGIDAILGLLLGGFGTVWGAIVGIPIVRVLPELFGPGFAEYEQLGYGLILLALVLLLPEGLVGGGRRLLGIVRARPLFRRVCPSPAQGSDVRRRSPDPVEAPAPAAAASIVAPVVSRSEPVLVAESLTKRFGGLVAVDGVSLDVRPGEILGLIGPNGAGKSTLMGLLAGAHRADGGRIFVAGSEVTKLPAEIRAAMGVARTFQIPRLPEGMTVLDVASLGAFPRGRSGLLRGLVGPTIAETAALRDAGRRALARAGIAHLADIPASSLSTGQQKLLELARALAASPQILLADEPAGGLSENEIGHLGVLLVDLAASGHAIVLVEHEMRLVMQICHRIVVLNEGRLIGAGSPDEVRASQEVVDAYLGV